MAADMQNTQAAEALQGMHGLKGLGHTENRQSDPGNLAKPANGSPNRPSDCPLLQNADSQPRMHPPESWGALFSPGRPEFQVGFTTGWLAVPLVMRKVF
jgi:hypothetical protein